MRGLLHVIRGIPVAGCVFMELLGAVRTLKFMAFTGNARHRNNHQNQQHKFHRAASYPRATKTQPKSATGLMLMNVTAAGC